MDNNGELLIQAIESLIEESEKLNPQEQALFGMVYGNLKKTEQIIPSKIALDIYCLEHTIQYLERLKK